MIVKWNEITAAFKGGDILGGFKAIGKGILHFMLMPLKYGLKLMSMIPGKIGESATAALNGINKFTGFDTVNIAAKNDMAGGGVMINPDATKEAILTERSEKTTNNNSTLEIKDFTGLGTLFGNDSSVSISSTLTPSVVR